MFGCCLAGPFSYYHYNYWLPKLAPMSKVPKFKELLRKVGFDQAIIPLYQYPLYLYFMAYMEGRTAKECIANVKDNIVRVFIGDLKLWPAAQVINFLYVPAQY